MKKLFYNVCRPLLATVLVATAFTACKESDESTTPAKQTTPLEAPFANVADVTAKSFILHWTAVENASTYAYSVTEAATRGGAPEEGLLYSPRTAVMVENLKGGTTYTVSVKAISKEESEFGNSEFHTFEVKTLELPVAKKMFDTNVTDILPTGFTCAIIPVDHDLPYIVAVTSKAAVEQIGSPEAYMDKYIASYGGIDWSKPVTVDMEDPWAVKKGTYVYKDHANMQPERDYVMMIRTGDKNKNEYTDIVNIHTKAIEKVECDFKIEISRLSYNRFDWSITPSNNFVSYAYAMVEAGMYEGQSEAQIINKMMAAQPINIKTGFHKENQAPFMKNNTEYGVYVVGCVQRQPTTKLTKVVVKTKKIDYDNLTGAAFTEIKLLYVERGTSSADAMKYVNVSAQMTPNEHTNEFRAKIVPISFIDGKTDAEIAKIALTGERNEWWPNNIYFWSANNSIIYDADYALLIISEDEGGNFGKLNILKFRTVNYKNDGTTPPTPPTENPDGPEDPGFGV